MRSKILHALIALLLLGGTLGFGFGFGFAGPVEVRAQSLVGLFELEGGARPAGMGGAFVGLAADESALYYNPAGLAFLRELYISGLYQNRFVRADYGRVTLAVPNVGVQFLVLGVGGLVRRDELGVPSETFNYTQMGALLGGGLSLDALGIGMPLAVGAQMKFYRVSTLAPGSGMAFSLTPSVLWVRDRLELGGLPVRSLRVGAIAPNLLSLGITYGSGHRESWGPGFRLGGALLLGGGLAFAADLDARGAFHLGGEWTLGGFDLEGLEPAELSLRLGLSNAGSAITPSIGFGIRFGDFRLDYAFTMHPDLVGAHRISFVAIFGPPNPLLCALRPSACPPDDPLPLPASVR